MAYANHCVCIYPILNTYAPALVAKIVYMVVLAFVAAVSVWMVRNWYQSEKQAKKQF